MWEREQFMDLEKVRHDILKRKVEEGLNEFKEFPSKQWVAIRLEKPLLEALENLLNKKTSQEERKMKMKNCPKCNSKMVYSSEGLLLSDGVEVEIIVCKKCGYEETVKEEV